MNEPETGDEAGDTSEDDPAAGGGDEAISDDGGKTVADGDGKTVADSDGKTVADDGDETARLERALAALECASDGIAIVDSDGAVEFANRRFARRLDYEPEALPTDWRDLFTAASVERVESDALAAVADEWEWIGTCAGRRRDGETVTLQTVVAAAPGGGFVLVVEQHEATAN